MTDEHKDKGVNDMNGQNPEENTQNNQNTEAQNNGEQERSLPKNVNSGLISLEIVARMNKIDIDMRSVVREFGIETADTSPEELMRIANSKWGQRVIKVAFKLRLNKLFK